MKIKVYINDDLKIFHANVTQKQVNKAVTLVSEAAQIDERHVRLVVEDD